MVELYQPLSVWMQLASLFFSLSGIHGDLLVIRVFLFLANAMLFLNALLGSPLWPDSSSLGGLGIDSLVWSIINLYVHGSSLILLILDERKVDLEENEAALWRLFYRTGGLSRRLFKVMIAPNIKVVEFGKGEEIPTDDYFYIIYQGHVNLSVYHGSELQRGRRIRSGEMFDLSYLGMFTERSVFTASRIKCTSFDRTKLFRFSKDDMQRIAHHRFAKGVWQSLLINNLSCAVEGYMESPARQEAIPADFIDRIFFPLEDWEQPHELQAGSGGTLKHPVQHLVRSVVNSFSPPWPFSGHPAGLRQTQLPPPPQQPDGSPQSTPPFHRMRSSILDTLSSTRHSEKVDHEIENNRGNENPKNENDQA